MTWFSSITINLGPTFLSGALVSTNSNSRRATSCSLIYAPYRHYILNVLWTFYNAVCIIIVLLYLRRLYNDLTKVNFETVKVTSLLAALVNFSSQEHPENQVYLSYSKITVTASSFYVLFIGTA